MKKQRKRKDIIQITKKAVLVVVVRLIRCRVGAAACGGQPRDGGSSASIARGRLFSYSALFKGRGVGTVVTLPYVVIIK